MSAARLDLEHSQQGILRVRLSGRWRLDAALPDGAELERRLTAGGGIAGVVLDAEGVAGWDSGLLTFVVRIARRCEAAGIPLDRSGLPEGARSLLRLASAVPERAGAARTERRESSLERLGRDAIGLVESTGQMVAFVGESTIALRRLLARRARFRAADLALVLQDTGASALGIISLVAFLTGLVLAYIGQAQLAQFGAKIYTADLVGLAMVREMGAMMTAIVLAGRTGAAFAAQLGTMTVNEEVDALRSLGIAPVEFLVLPRIVGLTLMAPLLCLYADAIGVLGGAFVGVVVAGLTLTEYLVETREAMDLADVASGLFKALVYGAIVAVAGCLRGMQCGRSAAAVGTATTSAVVTAIVGVVIASAVLTIVYDALGI